MNSGESPETVESHAERGARTPAATERVTERDGDDRADVTGGRDQNLTQRAGGLVGQGDAVDTGDSAGVISETANATAGWRTDTDPTVGGDATTEGARREALVGRRAAEDIPVKMNVEDRYQRARGAFERDFLARPRTGDARRTFEQAEPNYRAGFTAGHDLRYEGTNFEDVEPDLRREYETSTAVARQAGDPQAGGGESWDLLREEIRAGFEAARNPA